MGQLEAIVGQMSLVETVEKRQLQQELNKQQARLAAFENMLQILQETGGSTAREAAQMKSEFEQKLGQESRLTQAQFGCWRHSSRHCTKKRSKCNSRSTLCSREASRPISLSTRPQKLWREFAHNCHHCRQSCSRSSNDTCSWKHAFNRKLEDGLS